jgi:hypothetical protein
LVEQPIRNRQVNGSSPFVGSILFRSLRISSPKPAAQLLHSDSYFQLLHGVRHDLAHRLDVASLRRADILVAQDSLNRLSGTRSA